MFCDIIIILLFSIDVCCVWYLLRIEIMLLVLLIIFKIEECIWCFLDNVFGKIYFFMKKLCLDIYVLYYLYCVLKLLSFFVFLNQKNFIIMSLFY